MILLRSFTHFLCVLSVSGAGEWKKKCACVCLVLGVRRIFMQRPSYLSERTIDMLQSLLTMLRFS